MEKKKLHPRPLPEEPGDDFDEELNKIVNEPDDETDEPEETNESTESVDSNANETNSSNGAHKAKTKRIILGSVAGVVVLALLGGLVWWSQVANKPQISQSQRYASSQNVSNTKADEQANKARELADFYRIHAKMNIQPYYLKSRTEMTADEKKDAQKRAMQSFDEGLGIAFHSKASDPNMTDDMSKAYNKDGSMNANYTYLTAEYVSNTIYDDIMRLLNPVYGGWSDFYTKGNKFDATLRRKIWNKSVRDIFVPEFDTDDGNIFDVFRYFGVRRIDNEATKKQPEGYFEKGSFIYVPFSKKIPVGQMQDQIRCSYRIHNTDNDNIECEVPVRRIAVSTIKGEDDFIFDAKLRLVYLVNHDKSLSNRRILLNEFEFKR